MYLKMSLQKSLTYLLACFSTQLKNCSLEDYFLVYFCMFTTDNKNILCHFAKIHYFDYNHELVILIILILLSIMITMPILTICQLHDYLPCWFWLYHNLVASILELLVLQLAPHALAQSPLMDTYHPPSCLDSD
jgi:uncharacterized membrane protein YhaH (DUF805 family)